MRKLPKAWKWIIGAWTAILLATLAFYYFTNWRYPVPRDSQTIIKLSRASGWTGLIYQVTIYDDGTVIYEGGSYVGTGGIRKRKIKPERVKELADMIEQVGFFALEDKYYPLVYDAGSVYLYAKIGQSEKVVVRIDPVPLNLEIPDSLFKIEEAIDKNAKTDQWVDCNFERSNLCGITPLTIVVGIFFSNLALCMVWIFTRKNKGLLGILLGLVVISIHGTSLIFGNWSVPNARLTQRFVIFEFATFLPISLLLIWWHKRKTKTMHSQA
ncbi:MAG: hypothetical protein C4583_15560 [Anaerolineaceae bacterium]|nr:MAG: hypothetical protein C4583_15560 [Anaerolineaceae bacterium]